MNKHAIFAVLLLSLSACALPATDPDWRRAEGDMDQLQLLRDKADCHMFLDAIQEEDSAPPHRRVHEWDEEFIQCMAERGWVPTESGN